MSGVQKDTALCITVFIQMNITNLLVVMMPCVPKINGSPVNMLSKVGQTHAIISITMSVMQRQRV